MAGTHSSCYPELILLCPFSELRCKVNAFLCSLQYFSTPSRKNCPVFLGLSQQIYTNSLKYYLNEDKDENKGFSHLYFGFVPLCVNKTICVPLWKFVDSFLIYFVLSAKIISFFLMTCTNCTQEGSPKRERSRHE